MLFQGGATSLKGRTDYIHRYIRGKRVSGLLDEGVRAGGGLVGGVGKLPGCRERAGLGWERGSCTRGRPGRELTPHALCMHSRDAVLLGLWTVWFCDGGKVCRSEV